MAKKRKQPLTLEERYPTQRARTVANAALDKLPLETSLGEACRVWEWHYLDAGGIVNGGEGG